MITFKVPLFSKVSDPTIPNRRYEVEGPQMVCYRDCYYHPLNDHIYFPMWIAGFVCLGPCSTHSLTS